MSWKRVAAALVLTWPVLVLAVFVVAIMLLASAGTAAQQRTATGMLVNLILVVGLYIFVGNSGVISFGHVSFMAIGAYGTALLTIPLVVKSAQLPDLPGFLANAQLPMVPAVVIPALVAGAFAFLIGVPLMRLSGLPAAIATFSVLLIVHTVIRSWRGLTAGPSVLAGTPLTTTLFTALPWALVAIGAAYLFQRSRPGILLRATREDEAAGRALGINVLWVRLIAFSLSAAVVAVGGALFAHLQGAFDSNAFFLQITFLMTVMLVVGGMRSLSGAVLGTVVVTVLLEGLRIVEQGITIGPLSIPARPNVRELGIGVLLLVILILRPQGLTGGREVEWPFGRWLRPRPLEAPSERAVGTPMSRRRMAETHGVGRKENLD
jgi:branched-chain amino acid transport system permease protein